MATLWREQQEQVYLHPQQHQTLHPGIMAEQTHHHHHRSTAITNITTMDLPVPSNPRASRNMAEKQRRDNLNTNISAMATLVPTVAESPRKMDKISILRLAAAFLRMRYTVGRGTVDFLPRELGELDLEKYIVDNLIESGGFFIVITTTGKIVYVSRQVQEHLGHTQADLLGHSLYTFIHPKDHEELTKNLTPDEMQGLVSSSTPHITDGVNDNSNSSEDSTTPKNDRKQFREQRRGFELRMLHHTASRREHTRYEWFEISGMLRLADACKNSDSNPNRTKHREITSTSNDIVFVGVARLLMRRPITKISIIDANKDEYITRHLVDGRIIYCDHRISVVAGYLSEEVSGMSAFGFMHMDDRIWAMVALRQMYDRAETCGSSCYRLTSKTGESIYLRTHGYLEVDKDSQIAVSFVCINTLVSEEEGVKLMNQMKKRFSATISETMRAMIQNGDDASIDLGSDSQHSRSSVEDPSQLEDAITYLVSDLSSPLPEDRLTASPMPNEQYVKAAMISQHLPPAAAQARKLGIKKINHYLMVQGKGSRNQKQESKANNNKQDSKERQDKSKSPEEKITLREVTKQHNLHDNSQDNQSSPQMNSIITTNESTAETYISTQRDSGMSHLEASQNVNILSPTAAAVKVSTNVSNSHNLCKIKVERNMDTSTVDSYISTQRDSGMSHFENPKNVSSSHNLCKIKVEHNIDAYTHQQKPVMDYVENNVDNNITSDSKNLPLKRIYSDEDTNTSCSKKRHSNVPYASSDSSDDQQNVSCKSFIDQEFSEHSSDFNQYNNINPQSINVAESPNSILNDVVIDYEQQVDSSVPFISPHLDDEFNRLQDLKDDPLLNPGLGANPDIIMKIIDDLRYVPILENPFNETQVQQLPDNNIINKEIKRKHLQLMNSIALQESELNNIERDLKNPVLRAKRESLTPQMGSIQAEHNKQKQILETLQQDHMQINIKHNIGV
ncbi:circadian locomoter output cycles protein kaput isoform X1 [Bombus impatiens]|uniref:Circadian locomoter output cycles protein kaput isoform X1 n=1 Tax=Bombus impatiens TaxID=132113 RepID=A0A6P3DU10_BOMIM|nr:circadian locomoter output cycles protein kaput isoform X1 [Bombus impatiens]